MDRRYTPRSKKLISEVVDGVKIRYWVSDYGYGIRIKSRETTLWREDYLPVDTTGLEGEHHIAIPFLGKYVVANFKSGKRCGLCRTYVRGKLDLVEFFWNDRKENVNTHFDETGKVVMRIMYTSGHAHGWFNVKTNVGWKRNLFLFGKKITELEKVHPRIVFPNGYKNGTIPKAHQPVPKSEQESISESISR